jgi:hypothetical protein
MDNLSRRELVEILRLLGGIYGSRRQLRLVGVDPSLRGRGYLKALRHLLKSGDMDDLEADEVFKLGQALYRYEQPIKHINWGDNVPLD